MSIALGGCLRSPPLPLGLTEDSGGHLTYLWGAAAALAEQPLVTGVEIVTRLFDEPHLGPEYARPLEQCGDKLCIRRIDTGNRRYLSKDAAKADRPAFIAALLAELDRRDVLPDIVHAHFADAAEVAIAIRERFDIPFVYTAHSLGIDKADHSVTTPELRARIAFEDRAIREADAIVASSRDEAERQLMRYPSADAARIHRIAPGASLVDQQGVTSERARRLVAPFLRDPDKPTLLAIARPVHKKRLPALVELYATDPRLRDQANLVIVAGLRDGPDCGAQEQREVIRALLDGMDRHDLYGSLALPKRHGQDDIPSFYAFARETGGVFVNPAATEPYGLTLTEAATHGLPAVATSNGGASDIVRTLGHGISADPDDPRAFADAIARLLTDRHRWRTCAANGSLRSRDCNWSSYAQRFVRVAQDVLSPPARLPRVKDLLLSDIDGTLTGCRSGAAALIADMAKNPQRIFGVATGRSLQEARRILAEWNYPDPTVFVTAVGSEIVWRRGRRLISDQGYARHLSEDWDPDAIVTELSGLAGLKPQPAVEQRRFKRSWFADGPAVAGEVRRRLEAARLPARVIFSHGNLLDVLPERAGKAAAMRWVAGELGIPLSAVFAAGDSGNDRDMLEACPNAIVVANHCATLDDLRSRPNVRFAARAHAGGVLELLNAAGPDPDVRIAA